MSSLVEQEEDILAQFTRDGFRVRYAQEKLVFDELLFNDSVKKLKQSIVELFNNQILRLSLPEGANFTDGMKALWQTDPHTFKNTGKWAQSLPAAYQLMLQEFILHKLERFGIKEPIVNTKPVVFFHNKDLASEEIYYKTPGHQDYASMQSSLNSLVVWLPLAPITEDMGPLQVVPGSHRKGLQSDGESLYRGFGLVKDYSDSDYVSVGPLVPGDMVIFNSMLVHRSGDNKTDEIRWSANFRYADAMDEYWIKNGYYNGYSYAPSAEIRLKPTEEDMKAVLS